MTEDVKAGYGLVGYERVMGEKTLESGKKEDIPSYLEYDENPLNVGKVIVEENPQIEVHNKKGYGLTVNKQWSDLDITTYHEAVYVAVFVDGMLLNGSVKQIASPSTSAYYFWETLKDNRSSLEGYTVRKVRLTGDDLKVSDDNTVTGYDTVTPLESGSILHLNVKRTAEATPADETPNADFNYVVSYDQGADDPSTRTDTISNTREGGLQLRLFQWKSTEPLKDGKFTLTDSSGQTVGNYTSDGSGTITILYNFDRNSLYTLRQTAAPRGYVGLSISDSYHGQLIEENDSYIYTLSVPNTKKDPDLKLLTIEKQVGGAFGNKDREFDFTIEISGVEDGDDLIWAKNGAEQTAMSRTGGTFTMKHNDRIELSLPVGAAVSITEENDGYTTAFQLVGQDRINGNSIRFVFSGSEKLIVTNTLDGEIATGLSSSFARSLALLGVSAVSVGFVVCLKRRKKKTA